MMACFRETGPPPPSSAVAGCLMRYHMNPRFPEALAARKNVSSSSRRPFLSHRAAYGKKAVMALCLARIGIGLAASIISLSFRDIRAETWSIRPLVSSVREIDIY